MIALAITIGAVLTHGVTRLLRTRRAPRRAHVPRAIHLPPPSTALVDVGADEWRQITRDRAPDRFRGFSRMIQRFVGAWDRR